MATSSRLAAARALVQVFREGAYSNFAAEDLFGELSARDRSFAMALFRGVLERAITLDWVIGVYSTTKPDTMAPAVREALRCGFYQLLYMPSVPRSAAVNETVNLVRAMGEPGAVGFVNGVLRGAVRGGLQYPLPKDRLTAKAVETGVPPKLIALWRRQYGPEVTDHLLKAVQTPAPLFVRVNRVRTTPEALVATLEEQGVEARLVDGVPGALQLLGAGSPAAIPAFAQGLFHVQDISSQLCAIKLQAQPGMRTLDLCAAPGGKTFTVAQEMQNQGEIVAGDLYQNRLEMVEQGARRLGLSIIKTQVRDAREVDPALGRFHRVLCDVVCSGYGVLRRKPEIRYKDPSRLDEVAQLQYNILCAASNYLMDGGTLLYSTCTLRREENEEVVTRFLEEHPDFRLGAPMETLLPGDGWEGDGFFTAPLRRG